MPNAAKKGNVARSRQEAGGARAAYRGTQAKQALLLWEKKKWLTSKFGARAGGVISWGGVLKKGESTTGRPVFHLKIA